MKIKIEFDTNKSSESATVSFDGKKQGYIEDLTLKISLFNDIDFRLLRANGHESYDLPYVEELVGNKMVVHEGSR